MKFNILVVIAFAISGFVSRVQTIPKAPAPLFRCPVYDGAADPTVVYNRSEKTWWMLYTQRRANQDGADVSYCYGSKIGIASTSDRGQTRVYNGALDLAIEKAHIFYFTHPGRKTHTDAPNEPNDVLPYNLRRSSIQVAELKVINDKMTCNRDEPFDFYLP